MRITNKFILGSLVIVGLLISSHTGLASDFTAISAEELKAKMDAGQEFMLLNPLSDIEFNEMHIPGSVNIPLHTIKTTDKLPKDRNTLIVIYCLGLR